MINEDRLYHRYLLTKLRHNKTKLFSQYTAYIFNFIHHIKMVAISKLKKTTHQNNKARCQ